MNKGKYGVLLIAITIILSSPSCKKKSISAGQKSTVGYAAKDTLYTLVTKPEQLEPQFRWLRMNGKLLYETSSNSYTVNFNARLRKDSILWGNANLFIEVGRVLVKKDSAYAVIRPQSKYIALGLDELPTLGITKDERLREMQRLLLGRLPLLGNRKFSISGDVIHFTSSTPGYDIEGDLDKTNGLLQKVHITPGRGDEIDLTYGGYTLIEGSTQLYPSEVDIVVKGSSTTHVALSDISYTLVDYDDAPFTIPKGYKSMR